MTSRSVSTFAAGFLACIGVLALLAWSSDRENPLFASAEAADEKASGWSPTKPHPTRDVYYPGTEELAPFEMRVIACGTGMPNARPKQAAACFLVELGNGDKFLFDIGNDSGRERHPGTPGGRLADGKTEGSFE